VSQRTENRLTRILAMVPWVIGHPGTLVSEVCERFGYTGRELAADLDLVFMCGIPGYGPGDLMVAYIEEDRVVVDTADYFAQAPRLSPAEALGLLAAGLALLGTGQANPALGSAVKKLSRVIMPEGSDLVADEPDLLASLITAALERRPIGIVYTSLGKDETTSRIVEPWMVFSSLGNWYLSGHCRKVNAHRVFRVDRIRDIQIVEGTFTPPDPLPTPSVGYTPSEEDVRCVIALGPKARWLADYYPVEILGDEPDRLLVEFSAPDPIVAARLLLRLGPNASLIEGAEVAEELATLRKRILTRYRG
jgi:proteasome accessory factor C